MTLLAYTGGTEQNHEKPAVPRLSVYLLSAEYEMAMLPIGLRYAVCVMLWRITTPVYTFNRKCND